MTWQGSDNLPSAGEYMVQLKIYLENLFRTDALPSALDSEPWEKQEDPRVRWDEGRALGLK